MWMASKVWFEGQRLHQLREDFDHYLKRRSLEPVQVVRSRAKVFRELFAESGCESHYFSKEKM